MSCWLTVIPLATAETKKIGKSLEGERVQFIKGLSSIEELRQTFQSVDAVVHAGALSTAWGPWKAFYQASWYSKTSLTCAVCGKKRLVYIFSSIYAAEKTN